MNKDDLLLLLLAIALLLAALLTIFRGGERSKHGGYGWSGPSSEHLFASSTAPEGFLKVDSDRYRV